MLPRYETSAPDSFFYSRERFIQNSDFLIGNPIGHYFFLIGFFFSGLCGLWGVVRARPRAAVNRRSISALL